jgi:hypothetical protein
MEAMPPRGNPSVVPRDYSYTDAYSDRQCEFTFQLVDPGRARTRVRPNQDSVLFWSPPQSLPAKRGATPDSGSRWVGTGGPPLLRHLVGTGVPAGPFPGFLDGPE